MVDLTQLEADHPAIAYLTRRRSRAFDPAYMSHHFGVQYCAIGQRFGNGVDFLFEKKIQGCNMGSNRFRVDMPRYVDFYLDGKLNLDDLLSQRIALEDVNDAYVALERGDIADSRAGFVRVLRPLQHRTSAEIVPAVQRLLSNTWGKAVDVGPGSSVLVGDLTPVVSAAARALRPRGCMVFNFDLHDDKQGAVPGAGSSAAAAKEAAASPSYALRFTGRWAHTPAHVQAALKAAGLALVNSRDLAARSHFSRHSSSQIYLLDEPAAVAGRGVLACNRKLTMKDVVPEELLHKKKKK